LTDLREGKPTPRLLLRIALLLGLDLARFRHEAQCKNGQT
jgi:hypothetical protein